MENACDRMLTKKMRDEIIITKYELQTVNLKKKVLEEMLKIK